MKNHFAMAFVAVSAFVATSHAHAHSRHQTVHAHAHPVKPSADTTAVVWVGETGTASYYSSAYQGRRTASGAKFDQQGLTAAHPWLPFGTKVRVSLGNTGRSVIVTITDRLYSSRRVLDLSLAAAEQLGIVRRGVAQVSLTPA
jgi:rare lipoprotein A